MESNWPSQMKAEWVLLKFEGSEHYKGPTGEVEPIDLYYAGGLLHPWVVANIIKCAYRNRNKRPNLTDIRKIRHYCNMLEFIEKWGPTPIATPATPPEDQDA